MRMCEETKFTFSKEKKNLRWKLLSLLFEMKWSERESRASCECWKKWKDGGACGSWSRLMNRHIHRPRQTTRMNTFNFQHFGNSPICFRRQLLLLLFFFVALRCFRYLKSLIHGKLQVLKTCFCWCSFIRDFSLPCKLNLSPLWPLKFEKSTSTWKTRKLWFFRSKVKQKFKCFQIDKCVSNEQQIFYELISKMWTLDTLLNIF